MKEHSTIKLLLEENTDLSGSVECEYYHFDDEVRQLLEENTAQAERVRELEKLIDQFDDPSTGFMIMKKIGVEFAAEEFVRQLNSANERVKELAGVLEQLMWHAERCDSIDSQGVITILRPVLRRSATPDCSITEDDK